MPCYLRLGSGASEGYTSSRVQPRKQRKDTPPPKPGVQYTGNFPEIPKHPKSCLHADYRFPLPKAMSSIRLTFRTFGNIRNAASMLRHCFGEGAYPSVVSTVVRCSKEVAPLARTDPLPCQLQRVLPNATNGPGGEEFTNEYTKLDHLAWRGLGRGPRAASRRAPAAQHAGGA